MDVWHVVASFIPSRDLAALYWTSRVLSDVARAEANSRIRYTRHSRRGRLRRNIRYFTNFGPYSKHHASH
eukprot:23379-Eustigmatos_ZCMA.PRE.1